MTDELPAPFNRLAPRAAPPELRGRVLAAVERELAGARAPRSRRWQRAFELSVAACLALGIGLNVWQSRAEEAWHARVYGTASLPRGLANVSDSVESITDAKTARSVVAGLVGPGVSRPSREASLGRHYEQVLDDLTRSLTDTVL